MVRLAAAELDQAGEAAELRGRQRRLGGSGRKYSGDLGSRRQSVTATKINDIFTFISESPDEAGSRESSGSRWWRVGLVLEDVARGSVSLHVVEHGVAVILSPARLTGRGRQERSRGELTDCRVLVHYSHGLPLSSSPCTTQLLLLLLLLWLLLWLGRH